MRQFVQRAVLKKRERTNKTKNGTSHTIMKYIFIGGKGVKKGVSK